METRLFLEKVAPLFAPGGVAEIYVIGDGYCSLVLGRDTPREISIRVNCQSPQLAVSSFGRWLSTTDADKLAFHWLSSGGDAGTDSLGTYRFALDTVSRVFGLLVAVACLCGHSFTWTGSGFLVSFAYRDGDLLGFSASMQMPNVAPEFSGIGIELPEEDEGFVYSLQQFSRTVKSIHSGFDANDFATMLARRSSGKVSVPTAFAAAVAFERFLFSVAKGLAAAADILEKQNKP